VQEKLDRTYLPVKILTIDTLFDGENGESEPIIVQNAYY
jgi:hypothetical protein